MMTILKTITKDLEQFSDAKRAEFLQGYFKTAPGQYGAGDKFCGIVLPRLRKLANKYFKVVEYYDIKKLLQSSYHEYRQLGLFILVNKFSKTTTLNEQSIIVDFYLANLKAVNNWDLVDATCHKILGPYLFESKDFGILYRFSDSDNIWQRRIAIITTAFFIKNGCYQPTIKIATKFLDDKEDLIHKASGWMLREVGKKDLPLLEQFLTKNATLMPRTMLRYAIEKLPPVKRKKYLAIKPNK